MYSSINGLRVARCISMYCRIEGLKGMTKPPPHLRDATSFSTDTRSYST